MVDSGSRDQTRLGLEAVIVGNAPRRCVKDQISDEASTNNTRDPASLGITACLTSSWLF